MNNVDKFAELRSLAIQRGFPRSQDIQFYVPVRTRMDDRSYIPANADHALLWEPEWVKSLTGSDSVDTPYFDPKTLEMVQMPMYESVMVEMARIRAKKGDTIGYLFDWVKKHGILQETTDTS